MCGFLGAFGFGAHSIELATGLSAISHRGPDGSRLIEQNCFKIGACVLNTVPGEGWQQPFQLGGENVLCFNGVIYNAL